MGRLASLHEAGRSKRESWSVGTRSNRWRVGSAHRRIRRGEPWSGQPPQNGWVYESDSRSRGGAFSEVWGNLSPRGKKRKKTPEEGRPWGRPPHRRDEFPTGYCSAGCPPAEPASASPAGDILPVEGAICQRRPDAYDSRKKGSMETRSTRRWEPTPPFCGGGKSMVADEARGASLDVSPSQAGWQAGRGVSGLR